MKAINLEIAERLINKTTTLFWFRRDLRLQDNGGLFYALKEQQKNVLPLFIFDSEILNQLEDKNDRRVEFIHQSLELIKDQLEEMGSSLLTLHGNPIEIFKTISPKAVYTNHDYEPYARKRDNAIREILENKNLLLKTIQRPRNF